MLRLLLIFDGPQFTPLSSLLCSLGGISWWLMGDVIVYLCSVHALLGFFTSLARCILSLSHLNAAITLREAWYISLCQTRRIIFAPHCLRVFFVYIAYPLICSFCIFLFPQLRLSRCPSMSPKVLSGPLPHCWSFQNYLPNRNVWRFFPNDRYANLYLHQRSPTTQAYLSHQHQHNKPEISICILWANG